MSNLNICPVKDHLGEMAEDIEASANDVLALQARCLALEDALVEIVAQLSAGASGEVNFRLRTLETDLGIVRGHHWQESIAGLRERLSDRDR